MAKNMSPLPTEEYEAIRQQVARRTITVRFRTDKNGKTIAHYWGAAKRWLPIGVEEAQLKLATDPRYVSQGRAAEIEMRP